MAKRIRAMIKPSRNNSSNGSGNSEDNSPVCAAISARKLVPTSIWTESSDACSCSTLRAPMIGAVTAGRKGCAVVVEPADGSLEGMITEGDLRRAYAPDMFTRTARQIMSPRPVTVALGELVRDAVLMMRDKRISSVIVIDEARRPVSILDMKDLMERGYI
jgi:CBS domain-containing protein